MVGLAEKLSLPFVLYLSTVVPLLHRYTLYSFVSWSLVCFNATLCWLPCLIYDYEYTWRVGAFLFFFNYLAIDLPLKLIFLSSLAFLLLFLYVLSLPPKETQGFHVCPSIFLSH